MVNRKWIYYIVYILTVLDIAFTTIGLKIGAIEEANPIMDFLIRRSLMFTMLGVLILTAFFVLLLYKERYRFKWLPAVLCTLLVIKIYILFSHLRWIFLYWS